MGIQARPERVEPAELGRWWRTLTTAVVVTGLLGSGGGRTVRGDEMRDGLFRVPCLAGQ